MALAALLEAHGHTVWWDTSLQSGMGYRAAIDRELDAADAVIVIWTAQSVGSEWVLSEAEHGRRQKKLVTLRTRDVEMWLLPKPFDTLHTLLADEHAAILADLKRFTPGGTQAPGLAPFANASAPASADDRLFAEVEKAGTAEALQFYLDEFPQGAHAPVVRFRLKAAQGQQAQQECEAADAHQRSQVDRHSAEGRVKIDAKIGHGAPDGWFKPGAGKQEWFKDHDNGPEMVAVPAGAFEMGSRPGVGDDDERPHRTVTIAKPFAVGRGPVTRGQFAAFVNATGHDMSGGAYGWTGTEWKFDAKYSWSNPGFAQTDAHPVVCVNWHDAQAYIS